MMAGFVWLSIESSLTSPVLLDEYAHVPAGLSHWELGRYFLYRENPPLVRSLTSLAVLLSRPVTNYSRAAEGNRSEWVVGHDFLDANVSNYDTLIGRARSVTAFLAVICAALVFWWTSEDYGGMAGVVCAAIWLTDPTALTHSAIAGIDIGAATFGCLATYAFGRFLRRPGGRQAVAAGICLGLAESAKFSMLALYPAWLVLTIFARRSLRPDDASGARVHPSWAQIAAIFSISLLVLNLAYGFDEIGRSLGRFEFRSHLLTGDGSVDSDVVKTGNRFRSGLLSDLPVPLPSQYVLGFDSQKWEEELGFIRISRGRLVRRGKWYSPLETLLYKLPLGTITLFAASLGVWLVRSRRFHVGGVVTLVPALIFLGMLASQNGLNWPVQYALPILPLFAIAAGPGLQVLLRSRVGRYGALACVLWNVFSLLSIRPCYMSYANELAGGPEGGRSCFLGSNYDWGQDLIRLGQWTKARPDRGPLAICYYGVIPPHYYGIGSVGIPESFLQTEDGHSPLTPIEEQKTFFWAISSNLLAGLPANAVLTNGLDANVIVDPSVLVPDRAFARIGYTIFVFRVDPDNQPKPGGLTYRELYRCLRRQTEMERKQRVSP